MRDEFEKWAEKTLGKSLVFKTYDNQYLRQDVNDAWLAWQEQQSKIDEHNEKLKDFIKNLQKTHTDNKDNKFDFWRGFAECARSAKDVFIRDVGDFK